MNRPTPPAVNRTTCGGLGGAHGTDRHQSDGFTLIELMVVVLIIAILIAIAIPTFLGAQNRAKNKAAQSTLRNTLTAAKAIYAGTSDYTAAGTVALENVTMVTSGQTSTGPRTVSIINSASASLSPQTFMAAAWSEGGSCFFIGDIGGVVYYATTTAAASCSASAATSYVTGATGTTAWATRWTS